MIRDYTSLDLVVAAGVGLITAGCLVLVGASLSLTLLGVGAALLLLTVIGGRYR